MDTQLFITINDWAGHIKILDQTMIFFGKYLIYLVVGLVALLWFNKKLRWQVYLAFGATLINRGIIVEILKRLIHRPRPYQILGVHQLIADADINVSFPSGHAVIFFSFAFAFWGTKYFWPLFVLACLGSFARVFTGLHYPSDVLVGALIGAVMSLIFRRLFKKRILG